MTDTPPPDAIPAYGEDSEAASMKNAAASQEEGQDAAAKSADAEQATAKVLPDDVAAPVAGTTETDLAANIAEAADRKKAIANQP